MYLDLGYLNMFGSGRLMKREEKERKDPQKKRALGIERPTTVTVLILLPSVTFLLDCFVLFLTQQHIIFNALSTQNFLFGHY